MKIRSKILYLSSMATVLLAIVMVLYVLFYSFFPFRTVEYTQMPFPVLNENKVVRAGEELRYQVGYCRYTDLPTRSARSLQNDFIYTLPSVEVKSPVGCNTSITIVLIPKETFPGKYKLVSTLTWEINAFRTIIKQVETEEFTIIE